MGKERCFGPLKPSNFRANGNKCFGEILSPSVNQKQTLAFATLPHIAETMQRNLTTQRKRVQSKRKKPRKIKMTYGQLHHIINSTTHTTRTYILLLPLKYLISVQSWSSRNSHKPDWRFCMVMGVCSSQESQEAKI